MESLWKGFERRPSDPVLFARLRDALEGARDFSGLAQLYEQRAEAVQGEEALYLYLAIAEVWAARLGDEGLSSRAFRRVLEVSGTLEGEGRSQVRRSLRELFWQRSDWRALAELTAADAQQTAPGEERARLWFDLGELRLSRLKDVAGAAEAFRRSASEPGGKVDNVRHVLQGIVAQHPDSREAFAALRDVSAANLHGPHDARELLELLQGRYQRLDARRDRDEIGALLLGMGELVADHLRDPDEGLQYFALASEAGAPAERVAAGLERLAAGGDHPGVLRLLRDLHADLRRWDRAFAVGLREAEVVRNPAERAEIRIELAWILQRHLKDLDRACEQYNLAYELDPSRAEDIAEQLREIAGPELSHPLAVAALRRVYREQRDDGRLLELLEREEARERDPRRRAAILVDMAELSATAQGRPDRALEFYEAAAELAQDDVDRVVSGLFDLYSQGYYKERTEQLLRTVCLRTGRVEALVQLLRFDLEGVSTREEQAAIHFELGELNEQYLEDFEEAMHHYQRAFKLNTARPDYIEAGRDLYRKMGNLEMVARLFDIQLKVVTNPEEAARLLLDKSRVLGREMGDWPRALEALGRACALAPGLRAAHDALVELVRSPEGADALETLEVAYTQASRPAEAAAIYLMIADQLRERLLRDEVPKEREELTRLAADFDLKAYRLDPTGNARARAGERLEEALARLGRWAELVEVLYRRVEVEPWLEGKVGTLLRVGEIIRDRLRDIEGAIDAFGACLDLDPGEVRAFGAVEGIYRQQRRVEDTENLYRWALDNAPWALNPTHLEPRAELLLKLARLYVERGSEREAREAFNRLSEIQPNHGAVLEFFEAHAETEEGAGHLFRILERGLLELTHTAERAGRLARMARLAEEGVRDPLLAIDQYNALLAMQDVAPEVLGDSTARLRALLRQAGLFDELVEALERELAEPGLSAARRAELLQEVADTQEVDLRDLEAARETLGRLIALRPDDPAPRLRVADIRAAQGRRAEEAAALLELYELSRKGRWDRLQQAGRTLRPADVQMRMAVALVEASAPAEASKHLRALLENETHRAEALDVLQSVLIGLGDHEGLMELLDRQAARSRDTSDKIGFLARMAELAQRTLGDPERAITTWRKVLYLRPKDPQALARLEELYEVVGQHQQIIDTARIRLTVTTQADERAGVMLRIARVQRSLERLEEARRVLRELLDEQPGCVAAHEALCELHRADGAWEALVSGLDELLRHQTAPEARHAALVEQADVALHHLDNAGIAVAALEKVSDEFPDDLPSLRRLFELHAVRANTARAAEVLSRVVEAEPSPRRRAQDLQTLAALREEQLNDLDGAAAALRRLLELTPDQPEALARLEVLDGRREAWSDRVETRRALLALTTAPAERARLLAALAIDLEEHLGQPGEAFACVVEHHRIEPEAVTLLDELERLAALASTWPELLEVFAQDAAAEGLPAELRRELLLRMARITEVHIGEARQAFGLYGEVFLGDVRRGRALEEIERLAGLDAELWPDVIAMLDRLATEAASIDDVLYAYWRASAIQAEHMGLPEEAFTTLRYALALQQREDETLTRLRALAEATGQWQALVLLHDERWRAAATLERQIEILCENAEIIAEKLQDPELAFEQYVIAFQLNPQDEGVNTRLVELADVTGHWDVVTRLHEFAAESCRQRGDAAGQVAALLKLAAIHDGQRQNPGDAFEVALRALPLAPLDAGLRARFEDLGRRAERQAEVAQAWLGLASESPRQVAVSLLIFAAEVYSRDLSEREPAALALRRALQLDPEHAEARARLEELYLEADDVEALVAFYGQRADRSTDRDERLALYLRVARLLAATSAPDRAVDYYRRALRATPESVEVLQELADLYGRLQQPDRQAHTLEQLAEAAANAHDDERLALTLSALADLAVAQERVVRAIEPLQRLLQLRPHRVAVWDRLDTLLDDAGRHEERLNAGLRRVAQLDGTLAELELAAQTEDPDALDAARREALLDDAGELPRPTELRAQQRSILWSLVALAQESLNAPPRAASVLQDIVRRDPEDLAALEQLADIWAKLGRWDEHIHVLRQRLRHDADAPASAALLLRRIADVLERRLERPAQAAEALEQLLTCAPDDRTAAADLGRLYADLERWEQALERYREAASHLGEGALPPDVRSELVCRMAAITEAHLRDPARAQALYQDALDLNPENALARRALIRFLARTDDWERHTELLDVEARLEPSPERRAQLHAAIGAILRDKAHQPERAVEAFQQALLDNPNALHAHRDLADLAAHLGDHSNTAQLYAELLNAPNARATLEQAPLPHHRLRRYEAPEDPAFITYTVRQADALTALGDHEEAQRLYALALRTRANNPRALMGAARFANAQGQPDLAGRHWSRLLASPPADLDPADRAEAHTTLAHAALLVRQTARALEHAEAAIEDAAEPRDAVALALQIARQLRDPHRTVAHLQRLIDLTDAPEPRYALLVDLGDALANDLRDEDAALEAWSEAHALLPLEPAAADRVLRVLLREGRQQEAQQIADHLLQTLEGQLEDEPDLLNNPAWRDRFVQTLLLSASILENLNENSANATAPLERALAVDPSHAEALERLAVALARQGRLNEALARYRHALDALPSGADPAPALLRLGNLLKDRLRAPRHAAPVFEVLHRLLPDNAQVQHARAELARDLDPPDVPLALDATRRLIALGELTEARLRQLLALYTESGAHEGALMVLRLLDMARLASREDQLATRDLARHFVEPGPGDLAASAWARFVRPPLARTPLSDLFAVLPRWGAGAIHQSLVEAHIPHDALVSHNPQHPLTAPFLDAARILGMEGAQLYVLPSAPRPLRVALTRPTALVADEGAFKGLFNKEQRLFLGRGLESARPPYLLASALNPFDFMTLYEALWERGVEDQAPHRPDASIAERIRAWHALLDQTLPDDAREELAACAAQARAWFAHTRRPSVADWKRVVQRSALRTGLLLVGDPTLALKRLLREDSAVRTPAIRSLDDIAAAMSASEDLREAVLFLLSDDFVQARTAIAQRTATLPASPGDLHPTPEEPSPDDALRAWLHATDAPPHLLPPSPPPPPSSDLDDYAIALNDYDEAAPDEAPEPIELLAHPTLTIESESERAAQPTIALTFPPADATPLPIGSPDLAIESERSAQPTLAITFPTSSSPPPPPEAEAEIDVDLAATDDEPRDASPTVALTFPPRAPAIATPIPRAALDALQDDSTGPIPALAPPPPPPPGAEPDLDVVEVELIDLDDEDDDDEDDEDDDNDN